jgi:hypothetical protein
MNGFCRRSIRMLVAACPLATIAAPAHAGTSYVIVTREALVPEFQRLADQRTQHGVPAAMVTVEWIIGAVSRGT